MLNINHITTWIDLLSTFKVNPKYGNSDVIDQYLDQRDTDPFDSQWITTYGDLTTLIESMSAVDRKRIAVLQDSASKQMYERIIKQTNHADFAAYVSDDIRLIVGCLVTGHVTNFVLEMKESYECGNLPNAGESSFS
ncbi:hypothetical protein [Bacillus ndiopicus]|uniref:hypothetical protein n=1 Tax=Bacillus ndiopicus TaxID=1347368 RepID=UPI0005AB2C55|nr:hypothetical protein [Bacillus ndiopicus]